MDIVLKNDDHQINLSAEERTLELSQKQHNISFTQVGLRGLPGRDGQDGVDGTDSDKTYTTTFINSSFVTVNHNLNKYPSVTVINSANDEVKAEVQYISTNTIQLEFSASFSGRVTCN